MDFPKKQQQCLIPKYLLDYATELNNSHPDPTAEWSGGSGGSPIEAGTGIEITGDETKTISVDNTVAMKTDIPDVSDFITENEVDTKLEDYELKADAFSGSYDDLTDKPDLSVYAESADLGNCAYLDEDELSIAYSQITGTPTIPTKTSELTNDSGYITGVTWNDVTGKPTFSTVATSGDYDDLIDKPDLSVYELKSEAFSGDYDDLTDKPDLSVYALSSSLANVATTGSYNDLSNKPDLSIYAESADLASVATTGSYNDLTDKPTIPDTTYMVTTNTAQTITGIKTFDTDIYLRRQSFIKSNIKSSEDTTWFNVFYTNNRLVNLGSYSAEFRLYSDGRPRIFIDDNGTYNGYLALTSDIPTVPTNISAFTNDSGYITGITGTMVNTALGYTAANAANVPSSATSTSSSSSTSTVTPTTVTLIFTYSDNTTENITLMTGASVATTTTTTTTTTLS